MMLQPALFAEIPALRFGAGASQCGICHRALTNPTSRANGIGPICARKNGGREMRDIRPADQDVYDLPFDPETMDIICRRYEQDLPDGGKHVRLHYNIQRRHVHHSPSGWEWGYGGSGPSDYALNILAAFIPAPPDCGPMPEDDGSGDSITAAVDEWFECAEQRVKLYDGTYVHADVYRLHQDFKSAFVARLPREGGTISGEVIRQWIEAGRDEDDAEPADAVQQVLA